MAVYFAEEDQLHRFLKEVGPGRTYAAVRREAGIEYKKLCGEKPEEEKEVEGEDLALGDVRPSVSPKRFLTPPRECVARYGEKAESKDAGEGKETAGQTVVAGLRACDLAAAEYLDKVFLEGDFREPFYEARRKAQMVISVDCTHIHEHCFCDVVGGRPFALGGFDLNMSPISKGYAIWVGTDRGQALIDTHKELFREATEDEVEEVKNLRKKTSEELEKQNKGLKLTEHLQEVVARMEDSEEWSRHAAQCVECAACTNICPTCHCFYLYDRAAGKDEFERVKTWDSCLTADYSRMAGAGGNKPNPRPKLRTRFANRFAHKYGFSPIQYGVLGCTGCGRCMDACFGAVDIRKVLQDIEQSAAATAASGTGSEKRSEKSR